MFIYHGGITIWNSGVVFGVKYISSCVCFNIRKQNNPFCVNWGGDREDDEEEDGGGEWKV